MCKIGVVVAVKALNGSIVDASALYTDLDVILYGFLDHVGLRIYSYLFTKVED